MKTVRTLVLATATIALSWEFCFAQLGDDPPPPSDDRVEAALKELDINYTIKPSGDFAVTYNMGEDRTQLAIIRSTTSTYGQFEIREIWSSGYETDGSDEFPAHVANLLLEDTFLKKLGAWAKRGNTALFVSKISANSDSKALKNALSLTLSAADQMEEKLSGDLDKF